MTEPLRRPLGLFIQPACLRHKYIRHKDASHIFERPERLRAVLLGVAAAAARLELAEAALQSANQTSAGVSGKSANNDLSSLLSGLSIQTGSSAVPHHLDIVTPPTPPSIPGQVLLHHPALHLSHATPPEAPFPYLGEGSRSGGSAGLPSSPYLKDLFKWASEAVERIKATGSEIPSGMGLNQGDLYLGPGSVLAIEGAIQTVCQAIDRVCADITTKLEPMTPPASVAGHPRSANPSEYFGNPPIPTLPFNKAFCAIRPPGHHCGEDSPSGFCYVNNVVVGAMHAYLHHDIDRAIIIDFDLHHGNGTQALVMPLNAASFAEDLAVKAGKPETSMRGKNGKRRRGWKGFYGSVHDIYSYPCEDGDLDLIKDASISLAAQGQYIENIHLQPYSSEADFYERIYPKYGALLDKAKIYLDETDADPERTIILISAGFDACEHEYQAMQRHDRRVPASFFPRYTRDIVAFAEKYAAGKVVSVLEGGYSDRALTSAAMGHVLGLLDQPGDPTWWSEAELINIEKATKKKRTGKLAPVPSELSHLPHLTRTSAIFSHFESISEPAVPSVASTPQHPGTTGRMSLRERKVKTEEDMAVTPPPTAARRGRGRAPGVAASTANTPRGKASAPAAVPASTVPAVGNQGDANVGLKPPAIPPSSSMPALSAIADAAAESSPLRRNGIDADDLLAQALAGVNLDQSPSRPAKSAQPPTQMLESSRTAQLPSVIAPAHPSTSSLYPTLPSTISTPRASNWLVPPAPLSTPPPVLGNTQQQDSHAQKKIFLRFKVPDQTGPQMASQPSQESTIPVGIDTVHRAALGGYPESSASVYSSDGDYASARSEHNPDQAHSVPAPQSEQR